MNFLTEYHAGRVRPEDINAHVVHWHDAPAGSDAAKVDLHEFLGMTWEQYARWAATGQLPES